MLIQQSLIVGPFQCNCTILACPQTRKAVVIDAGDEVDRIQAALEPNGFELVYSLHTHAHLDHIGAISPLKRLHPNAHVALHAGDQWLYDNLLMQCGLFGLRYEAPPPVDHLLVDSEELQFGMGRFRVLHTPGHSPGGVCFEFAAGQIADVPVVFSGDTLFQRSIGRTDLWGGDHRLLVKNIKERLFTLDDQTLICPGHGAQTTVGEERSENPFV